MSRRAVACLSVLGALLLAAPLLLGNYGLSVLILVLYLAFVGQAWNIMMGFAGQLSLGHALYAGLGGYVAAGVYFHYGLGPWAGVFLAVLAAVAAAAVVGYLGFRFSLAGVYFALLTIAFAEFTRIGFDNWPWSGGSGGLFLRVERGITDVANLRGGPVLFYYVILLMAAGTFVLCRLLLESRLGRYWLAIREDAEAAQVKVQTTKFDLIFLDVNMPGLNGYQLCSKVRQEGLNKTTPVVFVTGLNDFQMRARSTLAGGSDIIAKPFLPIELAVKSLTHMYKARLLPADKTAA